MAWNDLKTYIGVENSNEDSFIQSCYNRAVVMLALATVNAFRPVPATVMEGMVLEVGNELYNRKNAPSGQSMYATFDGGSVPVRSPRDPLSQVRPILAMYVVPL